MSARDPIGLLRKRVSLEAPAASADTGGGAALAFVAQAQIWAEIRAASARERTEADALTSFVTHHARIRFRNDVRPGWRLAFEGRSLRIRHVRDETGERRWLDLDCEEETR